MQQAKVCLAPLRFGAGLKGKLVDAMQNGTPCVMSNIAAEGMFGEFEPNGFIENHPETFAQKAVELYTNAEIWKTKQNSGFKVLNQRFDKANFKDEFAQKIESLSMDLKNHRQNNFIGHILQHQTLQSTKYLSKWIEEKNR
jgi:glycosyltransferase involved in cell wall biosynthesis